MSASRGVVAGVLGLSLLQATLANADQAKGKDPGAVATVGLIAASAFRRLIDPAVPLIPDLRQPVSSSTTAPSSYVTTPETSGGTYRHQPAGQAVLPA